MRIRMDRKVSMAFVSASEGNRTECPIKTQSLKYDIRHALSLVNGAATLG